MIKQNKAGVSLVAVLLFMLVATIAATATYKWLTSEGHSSASRLQKQSAYQNAMAGIENTRAWMTYNANDVGALIKQYKDSGKKIKLNGRLTPWSNSDQNYDVWLVGVNTGAAHNFKLKVLSSGKSAGGAVHNEIGIFNVDGLYQVQIPAEEVGGATFDKAFDGKTTGITGSDTLQSGIIHGDFTDQNNTPKLTGNFVISGDMAFGGHVHGNGDMYVRGSITSKNGGYTFGTDLWRGWTNIPDTNVVYVGGDIDCADNQPIRVYGDLYVGGKIKERCSIDVTGNLTIGGAIDRTNNAAKNFTIGNNLVFKKNAVFNYTTTIEYGTGGTAGSGVGDTTYLAGLEGKNKDGARKINLGKKIYLYDNVTSYVHCRNRNKNSGAYRPTNCSYCEGFFSKCDDNEKFSIEDDRYFSFYNPLWNNIFYERVGNETISDWSKNDPVLRNIKANYWDNIAKMQGYGQIIKNDGTIPQAMLLKDSSAWIAKAKANNANCKIDKGFVFKKIEPPTPGKKSSVQLLNECYKEAVRAHEDWLYGGFLPIEWQYNQDGDPKEEKLDGKFVIYASTNVGNTTLPATTDKSVVMFYFAQGVTKDGGQLKGKHNDRGKSNWVYNYFFYSNGDIGEINGFNIKGSIVMSNGTTLKKYQGGNKLEFSSTVLNALVTAGIIKENPEFTRLVNGTASSTGGGEGYTASSGGTSDPYFIAASPQLRITLESQYENNEPLPSGEDVLSDVEPSFMVLPRIIYLPKNPYGKLIDYFSIVPLNGAVVSAKNVINISDCSDLASYSRADGSAELTAGLHTCKYTDSNIGQAVPFYVYVSNESLENSPFVQFETDYQEMGVNVEKYVEMDCPASTTSQEFKIKVSKPVGMTGWTIEKDAGATLDAGECTPSSSECTFKFNFSTDCASSKRLFKVSTTANEGTAVFQMQCESGCLTGSPFVQRLVAASSVTINREGIAAYCNKFDCSESLKSDVYRPDCKVDGNTSWINAVGIGGSSPNNCSIVDPNESWTCGVSSAIGLSNANLGDHVPAGCQVIIPENNNIVSNPTSGSEYTLYASLKARPYTFTVNFAGENLEGKQVEVRSERFTDGLKTCSYSASGCSYTLYAGDKVEVTVPSSERSEFSYWKCAPNAENNVNCPTNEPMTGSTYTIEAIGGPNSITAWFGQKDKHCFFDEFDTYKACNLHTATGDKMYCFSYCTVAACATTNAASDAKWYVFGGQDERDDLLQYEDGKVWLKDSYVRGKKQSNVNSLKILSTLQAGLYGTLKAQFQVPRMGRDDDESSSRVNKSGFLLRSDNAANSYLMLNVYANKDSRLAAKVCVADACREEALTSETGLVSVSQTEIVTLSATIKAEGGRDVLIVETMTGYYGSYTTATARFELTNIEGFTGLTDRATHEYVGFSLSDPAFKVYDVGWKSQDYNAECWDAYPTVKCSFRVAYVGGIVPENQIAKPWVGLSSWFDDKGCMPQYHYNGEDASDGCNSTAVDGYKECRYYKFSGDGATGIHGTTETSGTGDNIVTTETKMAMVKIQNCETAYLSDDARKALYAEAPRCGEFWVGSLTNCNQNVTFYTKGSGTGKSLNKHSGGTAPANFDTDELFSLSGDATANLRAANIKITLENPNASELEVYLRSKTTDGYGYYSAKQVRFSTSAVVKGNNVVTIGVEELTNELGFDVEHVDAVIIRNLGESAVVIKEIRSTCDYVTSIQCKTLEYTGDKFKVNAVVRRADGVKTYKITGNIIGEGGTKEKILEKTWTCETDDCPTGDVEGRISLLSNEYNPYAAAFDGEKTYEFTVDMTDASGAVEGSGCTTTPLLTLSSLSSECKWSSTNTKPSVRQGNGLPDFQYKLADCGGKTCAWEIYLDDTKIHQGTGTLAGFTSLPNEVRNGYNQNTETGKLSVQDHTISIRNASGDGNAVFNECSQTFAVIEESSGTGNLTCSTPSEVLKGAQIKDLTVYSSLEQQNFDVYFKKDGSDTWTLARDNLYIQNGQNTFDYLNAPNDYGSYTYKIAKDGSTNAECSGTFTVARALECSVSENNFVVSKKSFVSNCKDCYCSDGLSCSNMTANTTRTISFTPPTSGSKTLTFNCTCDDKSESCSQTVAVNIPEPTVGCPTSINAGAKETITFNPTSLTNCDVVNCSYSVAHKAAPTTPLGTGTVATSASSVSFTGEARSGKNDYILTVSNMNGSTKQSAECEFEVDYKDPTVSCSSTAYSVEPGAAVSFEPASLNYCGGGCKDSVKVSSSPVYGINTWTYTSPTEITFNSRSVANQTSETYTFKVTNQANKSDDCEFTVNYLKPTVACPAGMEKAASSSVTVTPTSVTNCTKGCKYKVTKGSATGDAVISEPSTYSYIVASGGTPGSLGTGFTGEAAGTDSVHYYVTLSNPAGSATCNFGVMYKSADDMCHCPCDDCNNIILTGGGTNTNSSHSSCYFAGSGDDKFRINDPCTSVKINGTPIIGTHDETELKNYGVTTLDDGYYIEVKHSGSTWCQYQVTLTQGTPTNPCGSGSSSGGGSGGGGGGSGSDVELSSQGMDSYTKGTYTLKTGEGLGSGSVPGTFKCRTLNIKPSTERVVGTIYLGETKKYDVSIPAYNDYSQGYALTSKTEYTFNVDNSIDDLECGLWF